jgi:hypothetical protein
MNKVTFWIAAVLTWVLGILVVSWLADLLFEDPDVTGVMSMLLGFGFGFLHFTFWYNFYDEKVR